MERGVDLDELRDSLVPTTVQAMGWNHYVWGLIRFSQRIVKDFYVALILQVFLTGRPVTVRRRQVEIEVYGPRETILAPMVVIDRCTYNELSNRRGELTLPQLVKEVAGRCRVRPRMDKQDGAAAEHNDAVREKVLKAVPIDDARPA
ncbi:hypothetical protein ACOSQ4_031376 [Xanthoceras sorbifolium]